MYTPMYTNQMKRTTVFADVTTGKKTICFIVPMALDASLIISMAMLIFARSAMAAMKPTAVMTVKTYAAVLYCIC